MGTGSLANLQMLEKVSGWINFKGACALPTMLLGGSLEAVCTAECNR